MDSKKLVIAAGVVLGLSTSAIAGTGSSPFQSTQLKSGYSNGAIQLADSSPTEEKSQGKMKDGKCGEGKCGDKMKAKDKEGKCGSGKCGGAKKPGVN